MRALFGTAGNPEAFYAAGKKQSKDMPLWLKERGLDAYEYQCGKGVTVIHSMRPYPSPSKIPTR